MEELKDIIKAERKKSARLAFRMPPELFDALEKCAKENNISIPKLTRGILTLELRRLKYLKD